MDGALSQNGSCPELPCDFDARIESKSCRVGFIKANQFSSRIAAETETLTAVKRRCPMKRGVLIVFIAASMLSSTFAFAQRGAGHGRGGANWGGGQNQAQVGTQQRLRIHQPGTGQKTNTKMQKRDRKRDGTGVNCPGSPCSKTQTQTRQQNQQGSQK